MLMTETEAATKWCPMARQMLVMNLKDAKIVGARQSALGPVANRWPEGNGFGGTRCIGSGCAMWQWASVSVNGDQSGYCGLAGEPAAVNGRHVALNRPVGTAD